MLASTMLTCIVGATLIANKPWRVCVSIPRPSKINNPYMCAYPQQLASILKVEVCK